jgi:AraC family transcriptional regulator
MDAGSLSLQGCTGGNGAFVNGACNALLFELDSIHLERLTEGRFPGARVEIGEHWAFKDPRLENLLQVLYGELRHSAPAGPIFAEQVGDAIAMLLAKQYSTVTPGAYGSGGRIPTSRLKKVFDYVEAYLHEDVHLSDLAKTAAMSAHYFAQLFKNSTGVCPHQYVTQRRIARAKELLRNSEISVFEIGVSVGYADPKHFRNLFRRQVGVSPSDFRGASLRR